MLDERMDPLEMDEIIRDWNKTQGFRKKVGAILRNTEPVFTKVDQ
jgi:hypothetical protein